MGTIVVTCFTVLDSKSLVSESGNMNVVVLWGEKKDKHFTLLLFRQQTLHFGTLLGTNIILCCSVGDKLYILLLCWGQTLHSTRCTEIFLTLPPHYQDRSLDNLKVVLTSEVRAATLSILVACIDTVFDEISMETCSLKIWFLTSHNYN